MVSSQIYLYDYGVSMNTDEHNEINKGKKKVILALSYPTYAIDISSSLNKELHNLFMSFACRHMLFAKEEK